MSLLPARVDTTVIALWLGHADTGFTQQSGWRFAPLSPASVPSSCNSARTRAARPGTPRAWRTLIRTLALLLLVTSLAVITVCLALASGRRR
jgi:hypothetical protein